MADSDNAGGFMQPPLLSPPSSSIGSSIGSLLPTPRSTPLKLGSLKESIYINTVDQRITHITRMIANKGVAESYEEHVQGGFRGYNSFKEVARDISRTIDLVWVSGSPTLQIAYLIRLSMLVLQHIPSFPPTPKAMFRVINKLDYAFTSLILEHDLDSGTTLPGLGLGRSVNPTEKVRIKSLAEATRVVVVRAMNSSEFEEEDSDTQDREDQKSDTNADHDMLSEVEDLGGENDMEIARVYNRTLVELGDSIGGPEIENLSEQDWNTSSIAIGNTGPLKI